MKERVLQLDYLKGIFIMLMVIFHISYFTQTYPILHDAVYTFHMPAFLIISGYLSNVEKDFKLFCIGMMRLVIPYVIFETLYILLTFYIGEIVHANNSLSSLNLMILADEIAEHPKGTYWYIHTLIICTSIYFLVYKVFKLKAMTGLVLTGFILYGLTIIIAGFGWANVIYFLIGICINRSGKTFMEMISPSLGAILPLCVLFSCSDNYHNASLAGITITILVISFLLYVYTYCPCKFRRVMFYLGRNSLAIVLFSPLFSIITKFFTPYFLFDQTTITFVIFASVFIVSCSIFCAWLCDKLHISRFIFYKENLYVNY